MNKTKAERGSGNCQRSNVPSMRSDGAIIARDVALGAFGALLIVGIPFVMALMKQWGWW